MWLEIYYQVVWGRFGMVCRGFVDIWKVLYIQSRLYGLACIPYFKLR